MLQIVIIVILLCLEALEATLRSHLLDLIMSSSLQRNISTNTHVFVKKVNYLVFLMQTFFENVKLCDTNLRIFVLDCKMYTALRRLGVWGQLYHGMIKLDGNI